jgi:hypothetical protein
MANPRELFKDSRQSDRVREAPECRWRRADQGGEADLSRLVGGHHHQDCLCPDFTQSSATIWVTSVDKDFGTLRLGQRCRLLMVAMDSLQEA